MAGNRRMLDVVRQQEQVRPKNATHCVFQSFNRTVTLLKSPIHSGRTELLRLTMQGVWFFSHQFRNRCASGKFKVTIVDFVFKKLIQTRESWTCLEASLDSVCF